MANLKSLCERIGAQYVGEDLPLTGAAIDSRECQKGDLFVCIKGPNHDGHEHAQSAIEKGAAVLMVERPLNLGVPEIQVDDTTKGMGVLAAAYRSLFTIPIIALTGSCGKTGTREMIASICRQMGKTHSSSGNFNNHWGLPLTLLNLREDHQFAVIEMGTSAPGEIEYLAKITRPTIALITNIREQHVEGLGSVEGISIEKSDIFKYLTESGIAVLNEDEPFAKTWGEKIDGRACVSYSCHDKADVYATDQQSDPTGTQFTLHSPIGEQFIQVPLLGGHVVENTTAAAAVTLSIGASLQQVSEGLSELKPFKSRLYPYRLPHNVTLIDDTYNASPAAVESAIAVLGQFKGKRIFVMSSLAELGEHMGRYHTLIGEWAMAHQIDHVLLTGQAEFLKATLDACDDRAVFFNSKALLSDALKALIVPGTTILVKGTHGNHMEEIVGQLLDSQLQNEKGQICFTTG